MRNKRNFWLALGLVLALTGGFSQAEGEQVGESEPPEVEPIPPRSQLTDRLAAASVWAEVVVAGARADTLPADLAGSAAHMDAEVTAALDLATRLKSPGEDSRMARAATRIVERLEEARRHVIEIGKLLASGEPDRPALTRAAEAGGADVEAAGIANDSLYLKMSASSSPREPFRMFALTRPHHELALRYAMLDGKLSAMEGASGSGWAHVWQAQLDAVTDDLLDCRLALRAFADKLDALLDTYGRERRDDRFNSWTDDMRHRHDAIRKAMGDIRRQLDEPAPNRQRLTRVLGSVREDLEAARADHRMVAAELGQPYPDYASAPAIVRR